MVRVRQTVGAPTNLSSRWASFPAGQRPSCNRLALGPATSIVPTAGMTATKVPNATRGMIQIRQPRARTSKVVDEVELRGWTIERSQRVAASGSS
jgi:hypothetical protein